MDRPDEFAYQSGLGVVAAVYPAMWEVDVRSTDGGLFKRALVVGPRLPEVSTADRPQWVLYSSGGASIGRPFCMPIPSRLPGNRPDLGNVVYYEEFLQFRITGTRDGVFEILNSKELLALQFGSVEGEGVIYLALPGARVVLRKEQKSIELNCDGDAKVTAGADLTAKAVGNVSVEAGGNLEATAEGDINLSTAGGAKIAMVGNQVRINEPSGW